MSDMISRADAIAAINDASGTDLCSCSHCRSGYNTAIAKISAMPAVEVGVRELEWEQVSPRRCEGVGYNCIYQIRVGTDGRVRWQGRYMGKWEDADSVEAAKAAAQADYAARIRSALTATPAQDCREHSDIARMKEVM